MADTKLQLALAAHAIRSMTPPDLWDALVRALASLADARVASLISASQEGILQAQGRAQQANEIGEVFAECTEKARQHLEAEKKRKP